MHTTHDLIELAKQRLALAHELELPMTDYRLAKLMNIKQSTVSAWRVGKARIGTHFAAQFAQVCELPEEYVYACIEHEREKDPSVLRVLESIAEAFKGKAAAFAAIIAVGAAGVTSSPSTAYASDDAGRSIHYAQRRKKLSKKARKTKPHKDFPDSSVLPTSREAIHRRAGKPTLGFYDRWNPSRTRMAPSPMRSAHA